MITIAIKIGRRFVLGMVLSLFLYSCSNYGYRTISDDSKLEINNPYIFEYGFEKALYKTNISIYNNQLTGLTLIKKTEYSYRVVSMSELGLKYFDIEFPIDLKKDPMVHYIMEPLNKKLLVNMFIKDFSLIFYPPSIDQDKLKIADHENLTIIKLGKLVYYVLSSGQVIDIKKSRWLASDKSMISINGFTGNQTDSLVVDHGKIMYEFIEIVK